ARAWVEIDLGAIAANVRLVTSLLRPGTRLLAVVKADAYGHGAGAASRVALAHGASVLGVATVDEGIALRSIGIDAPILVLGYVSGRDSIASLAEHRLSAVVCSPEHASELASTLEDLARGRAIFAPDLPLGVHAKLDTGMSRLGYPWSSARQLIEAVRSSPRALRLDGVCSHFAMADAPSAEHAREQLARFLAATRAMGDRSRLGLLHIANSAALLRGADFHLDMVRVGLLMYGLLPAPCLAEGLPLRSAMQVRARVTQVRRLARGERVSYGGTYIAERSLVAATVGIGYADGVPFCLSGRMAALIHGRRVPQLGRITMDQLILDVSSIPGVAPGDIVTLIGLDGADSIDLADWARTLGSLPWEIPCLFKSRLPRVAIEPRVEVERELAPPIEKVEAVLIPPAEGRGLSS